MHAADAILRRLIHKYRSCRSYKDKGYRGFLLENQPPIPFRTLFVRNGRFRFEWETKDLAREDQFSERIWFDGLNSFIQTNGESPRRVRYLASAVNRASFGSLGVSRCIPALLMPERVPDSTLLLHGTYQLHSDHDFKSHILLRDAGGVATELWIDKEDFFLEKIVQRGATEEQRAAWARMKEIDKPERELKDDIELENLDEITYMSIKFTDVHFDVEIPELEN